MRKDLAKLTTESSRAGGYGKIKYGGKARINHDPEHDYLDEFGGYRSSARLRHMEYKSFTDVLNPLRGAVRKNLGRPWNDVFSEFCAVLDRRGVSGYHIWTHLMQEVAVNTYLGVDGKVYEKPNKHTWYSRMRPVEGFYVHPVSGLLRWADREIGPRMKARPEIKVPGEKKQVFRKVDGLWFRVEIAKVKTWWPYKEEEVVKKMKSCNRKEIRWIESQLVS